MFKARNRPERGGESVAGVATDVGDHVGLAADPPQRRARPGQHRPPHLVTVGAGHNAFGAGTAGPRCQQGQWRSGAEPYGCDAVFTNQRAHPPVHSRLGQHQCAGVTDDGERRRAVVVGRALPPRRIDRQLIIGPDQVVDELFKIGLDTTASRRKVVGDQQDSRHQRRASWAIHCAHRRCRSARSVPITCRTAAARSAWPGPQAAA